MQLLIRKDTCNSCKFWIGYRWSSHALFIVECSLQAIGRWRSSWITFLLPYFTQFYKFHWLLVRHNFRHVFHNNAAIQKFRPSCIPFILYVLCRSVKVIYSCYKSIRALLKIQGNIYRTFFSETVDRSFQKFKQSF